MGIFSGVGEASCGSAKDGVRIELKSKTDLCKTKPYGGFYPGDNLDWTGELLGNCKTALFDPMEETISFFITTDIDDEFCPISVKIILNDQTSTSYSLELPDGDYHNSVEPDYTNNITYTAKKLPGKICTLLLILKFIYSEKATEFCEIFTFHLQYIHRTKVRLRFRKILWPSQNT